MSTRHFLQLERSFGHVARLAIVSGAFAALACGGSSPTAPVPGQGVNTFIAGVQTLDGVSALLKSGAPPAGSSGPAATVTTNATVINGGSSVARVRASSSFQTVVVIVSNVTGGISGYWELRLSSPTNDTTILVSFGRTIPAGRFDCGFAVGSGSGTVGTYATVPTTVSPQASTGEVQVSVSWDSATDVDLHVVEPGGTEIYYGRRTSAAGGALDLDSNPGCSLDLVNNENIRWPIGRAPAGNYSVRVDYYDACGLSATQYVVTVNNGGTSSLYRGSFSGFGDHGGSGSGRLIAQFSKAAAAFATGLENVDLGRSISGLAPPAQGPKR